MSSFFFLFHKTHKILQHSYYLPVSPCPRNITEKGQHYSRRPNKTDTTEMLHWFWIQDYIMRPKHFFRKRLLDMRTQLLTNTSLEYSLSLSVKQQQQLNCTAMHIRRGDAGLPVKPYRRYAAVQGKCIVLCCIFFLFFFCEFVLVACLFACLFFSDRRYFVFKIFFFW